MVTAVRLFDIIVATSWFVCSSCFRILTMWTSLLGEAFGFWTLNSEDVSYTYGTMGFGSHKLGTWSAARSNASVAIQRIQDDYDTVMSALQTVSNERVRTGFDNWA